MVVRIVGKHLLRDSESLSRSRSRDLDFFLAGDLLLFLFLSCSSFSASRIFIVSRNLSISLVTIPFFSSSTLSSPWQERRWHNAENDQCQSGWHVNPTHLIPSPHPLKKSGGRGTFFWHWKPRGLFRHKVLHLFAVVRENLTHSVHRQLVVILQVLVHITFYFISLRLRRIAVLFASLNDVLIQNFLGFGINLQPILMKKNGQK